jgi:hypothetical protein
MDWKTLTVRTARGFSAIAPVFGIPIVVLMSADLAVSASEGIVDRTAEPSIERVEADLEGLARGMAALETRYREKVVPVERVLGPFHEDEDWIRRISVALVREAEVVGMDPRVLASVVLVEDPWLDPEIESSQGALGLMQVMPFHAGRWGCPSNNLTEAEANICHGARIFEHYLRLNHGDVDRALLAYNGCVDGTNTPDCQAYPGHVYARAGRAVLQQWLPMD